MENYKALCASHTVLNSVQVLSAVRGQDTNGNTSLSLLFAMKHRKPQADVEKNEWHNFLQGSFVVE